MVYDTFIDIEMASFFCQKHKWFHKNLDISVSFFFPKKVYLAANLYSFVKIWLVFRAIFGSFRKWKKSKNGSKMAQKGLKWVRKVSEKYKSITKRKGPKIVQWNPQKMLWKWAILLQNEPLCFDWLVLLSKTFQFIP